MPTFICTNEECGLYLKEQLEPKSKYTFSEVKQKLISDKEQCPECKSDRDEVKNWNGWNTSFIGPNVTRWSKSHKGTIY